MNVTGLLFLLVANYLIGKGLLTLFRMQLQPLPDFCFSMMLGVPVMSFAPCAVQLLNIPITAQSIFMSVLVCAVLFSVPLLVWFKRPEFKFNNFRLPDLSEVPFLIVIGFFMIMSVWRCFYLPVFSRDMTSGPELLSKYAILEKTMVSSVFSLDLSTTNNYFKSPFITCLQIIYKLLAVPFGQLWLSVLFLSFTIWLYSVVRKSVHPFLAGMLMMFYMIIPELYAYTYLILYDYSNMVFFFTGFYFLVRYLESKKLNEFFFSAFLFGLATYIRTETLILLMLLGPLLLFHFYKSKAKPTRYIPLIGAFFVIPAAFYFICMNVFVKRFVPVPLDVSGQVNPHLLDFSTFFQRLSDINGRLIFSQIGTIIYGYFIVIFMVILVVDALFFRRFNREARLALYGVAVVYFGLGLVGYILPLADLMNTTKRGMFKILPMMLWYMCNSSLMLYLSTMLNKKKETVIKAVNNARPANHTTVNNSSKVVNNSPVAESAKQKGKQKGKKS